MLYAVCYTLVSWWNKKNKGFTLVEILTVIVILGILFAVGITAYSKYKDKARIQGYDTMAKSASQAASEYRMDHPDNLVQKYYDNYKKTLGAYGTYKLEKFS